MKFDLNLISPFFEMLVKIVLEENNTYVQKSNSMSLRFPWENNLDVLKAAEIAKQNKNVKT